MRAWHILRSRIRSALRHSSREDELAEELRLHVQQQVEQWVARGMDPEAARLQALRQFGAIEVVKEECRDARGMASFEHLRRDTRHAARRLVRDWRFTAAAVVILGLGIGANTAIFSLIDATLFVPPPFANPERLVEVYQNTRDGAPGINTYPAYLDVATATNVFAGVAAVTIPNAVTYRDRGAVREAIVEYASPSYASVLGLRPFLGRWFIDDEDRPGAPVVTVLGHRTWRTQFGADASVIGRTIRMQGKPVTIVGIAPAGYQSTFTMGVLTEFWLPLNAIPALDGPPRALERRPIEAGIFIKARLRDDVTVSQAQAAMDVLGKRLAAEYPNEDPGRGITVRRTLDVRVHPQFDTLLAVMATLLMGAVGLVLAIACSNLATLLLVRASARGKEVSVRLAIGASRWQLVRHLLTESVLLSVAGGVVGGVLAWAIVRSLQTVELPVVIDIALDYRVLVFALLLSLATGVLFGLAPALKATRVDILSTLREDSQASVKEGRRFTLKNALVVFQVTVSVVLLATTAVFLQMVAVAQAQRVGYTVDGLAILETDARYSGYTAEQQTNLYEELRRRIAAIPGVQSALLMRGLPMNPTGLPIEIEGGSADGAGIVSAGSLWAAPGFLKTMQIPLLFGRGIGEGDRQGAPRVAVISESMARHFFGEVNAVGRRFRIDRDPNWMEVVGVVRDTGTDDLQGDLLEPSPHLFFRPFAQSGVPPDTIIARTSSGAAPLVAYMQRELLTLDPSLPVFTAMTMAERVERSLGPPRAVATFLGALGALGLALAGVGLYAVVAFAVSRRSREIGIRMALGARSREVVWSIGREVAALLGVGAGMGLSLAALVILAMRAFSNPAPGIQVYRPSFDPLAMLAVLGFLLVVGLLAAALPARRAARMNPLSALRHE
jgi:predicted permease